MHRWQLGVYQVCITHGSGELQAWHVHNFGVLAAEMQEVEENIAVDVVWASESPLIRSALMLGDGNLATEGLTILCATPMGDRHVVSSGQHRRAWHRVGEACGGVGRRDAPYHICHN